MAHANLYRVIPYDASAAPTERGGALFVPRGGENRIDNSTVYDVLYVAATREGAIAETFARLAVWTPDTFVHASGKAMTLLEYEVSDAITLFELDDVDALKSIDITRPRAVVTRDRAKTQAWARTIYERGGYTGARWWTYYQPDWTVVGLWDRSSVMTTNPPEPLTTAIPVVKAAAAAIVRQIAP